MAEGNSTRPAVSVAAVDDRRPGASAAVPRSRRPSLQLGTHRIYLLLLLVGAVMAAWVPGFLSPSNFTIILKGMSTNALLAIGFTLVLICGRLDLSIAATMVVSGMIAIKTQPSVGWWGSIPLAVLFGAAVGAVNGLLVTKAKVDSFIVTLGTMTVLRGLSIAYSGGDSIQTSSYGLGIWLDTPFLPLVTPMVLLAIGAAAAFELVLKRTAVGRGFYLVGGNLQTAWYSGLAVDRYLIAAFVLSGICCGLGGALYAILNSAATVRMGDTSLMLVIAAVIIGGTSMTGGKGSVVKSLVALVTLTMLTNAFSMMGAGAEVQKIVSGIVLGGIIVYDAWLVVQKNRTKGVRHELLEELSKQETNDETVTGMTDMQKKDQTLAIVCVTAIACTAIVAIFAMYFIHQSRPAPSPLAAGPSVTGAASPAKIDNLAWSLAVDTSKLKASDGQPLIPAYEPKSIPPRPENPQALPETDAGHWYDMEFAGFNLKRVHLPKSPANGARGKRVTYLKFVDHPYLTAMSRGMQKIADAYQIQLKTMVANSDVNLQGQQVDQTIQERPDLVIINPVDAKACVPHFRKLNEAGIPIIASNLLPVNEAMQYVLCWTGPDDWGQFRQLAREFARRMKNEGGYCVVRHFPGGSPYFSRTYGMVTELKKIAPKMEMLDMQTTDLDANKTEPVVVGWIKKYGPRLKGIVSADDSGAQVGINQACKDEDREDIIRVAAGNSKVGMDFVKAGTLHAITYQPPESDGALPMQMAADWFDGKSIPEMRYLPIRIITHDNVDQYMPAQW